MMDRKSLAKSWGFTNYPFETFVAENELDLESYFIPPPYFSDILGDPFNPSSSIVFGRRGDGKTAIRRMVISKLLDDKDNKYLIVEYVDFTYWDRFDIEKIQSDQHIERILCLAIDILIQEIEENPSLLEDVSDDNIKLLQWYILRFLPGLDYEQIEKRLIRLLDNKIIPKRLMYITGKGFRRVKSYLRRKRFEFDNLSDTESNAVQIIKSIIYLFAPSMPGAKTLINESMINLYRRFIDLATSMGYIAVLVFIDKIDETERSSDNIEVMTQLISPVVKTISFLEIKKSAIKFFLPSWIQEELKDLRTDRIKTTKVIKWINYRLEEMLCERLKAFSGGKISSLQPFVDPVIWSDFKIKVICYSGESPRNLIRLLDYILSELCESEPDPKLITSIALDSGIKHFLTIRLAEFDFKEYELKIVEQDCQGI